MLAPADEFLRVAQNSLAGRHENHLLFRMYPLPVEIVFSEYVFRFLCSSRRGPPHAVDMILVVYVEDILEMTRVLFREKVLAEGHIVAGGGEILSDEWFDNDSTFLHCFKDFSIRKGHRRPENIPYTAVTKPMDKRGKLIVIDGSDGVGKATQTKLLVERLKQAGKRVETLDFPQYTENFFGSFLKECLTGGHGDFISQNPYLVSIAYAADRWESKKKLEKWLSQGAIVILNRYVSSNQMHQGGKIKNTRERTMFLTWLDTMEHEVFGLPRPAKIIYLHVPVKVSLQLMKLRGNADLAEQNPAHLERTQQAALKIIESKNNWKKIDCTDGTSIRSREDIHAQIYKVVQRFLGV